MKPSLALLASSNGSGLTPPCSARQRFGSRRDALVPSAGCSRFCGFAAQSPAVGGASSLPTRVGAKLSVQQRCCSAERRPPSNGSNCTSANCTGMVSSGGQSLPLAYLPRKIHRLCSRACASTPSTSFSCDWMPPKAADHAGAGCSAKMIPRAGGACGVRYIPPAPHLATRLRRPTPEWVRTEE